jgi:hypothetical protein
MGSGTGASEKVADNSVAERLPGCYLNQSFNKSNGFCRIIYLLSKQFLYRFCAISGGTDIAQDITRNRSNCLTCSDLSFRAK